MRIHEQFRLGAGVLAAALLLTPAIGHADLVYGTAKVHGKVKGGVTLQIDNGKKSVEVKTNAAGLYRTVLPAGKYTVSTTDGGVKLHAALRVTDAPLKQDLDLEP